MSESLWDENTDESLKSTSCSGSLPDSENKHELDETALVEPISRTELNSIIYFPDAVRLTGPTAVTEIVVFVKATDTPDKVRS